jgi:(4-alkanoyl-5-oxo-2,5-dihydrofuran-3-yl)methyl phosphate reductase
MILVSGASGHVGREVVQHLLAAGQPVRVFVRDERKVADLAGRVEIAVGDFYNPASVEAAMQGVARMFLLDFETEQVVNTLAAAQRSGLRHIVKLSTIEAGHEPMIGHGKHHREREELIRASGLAWTFLRPTIFMTNALDWAETVKSQATVYYPGGEGRVSPVDPWDIAAVAAASLTDPRHECQAYPLTGPGLLSFGEMAQVLARVLGRPIRYVDIPDSVAGEGMRQAGLPEYVVEGLIAASAEVRRGRFAYTTDAVERVTGRPPRTFETWCEKHKLAFFSQERSAQPRLQPHQGGA